MLLKSLLATLPLVAASPHGRRQMSDTPAPAPPADASSMMPPVGPSGDMSMPMPSASMPPVMSSGSSAAMPSMMPSASASGMMSMNPAFPCPSGYLLTYYETTRNFMMEAEAITPYVQFDNSSYMYMINATGNEPGAMRYLASPMGAPPKEEVYAEYTTTDATVALNYAVNLTSGPIMVPSGTMLSNYSTVLQVYNNATASTGGQNTTTVKLFCNFCAADQMMGMQAVMMNFMQSLDNLNTLLMGGTLPSTPDGASSMMASGMPSMMAPSAAPSASAPSDMPSMPAPGMSEMPSAPAPEPSAMQPPAPSMR